MGIGSLPTGRNPIDARVSTPLLADLLARGKAGGYPADIKLIYSAAGGLFNQAPQRRQDRGIARRRRVHRRTGSLPDPNGTHGRHRVARDDLLGTQRRPCAVVRRGSLRDLHAPGDRADVRMPQRYRHLRRLSRRLGINGYNTKSEAEWLREFTSKSIDDFDAFAEQGVARFPPPRDAMAFAAQSAIPSSIRSRRHLVRLKFIRRPSPPPPPVRPRRHSPHSHLDRPSWA